MTTADSTSPVTGVETVYSDWTELKRVTFTLRSGLSVTRHVEDHGRSVCVLPYDPERACALLVSMVRAPVVLAMHPDLIEVPAGRCDARTDEEIVRAEALEECGVRLRTIEPVLDAWTMPAVSAERSAMFIAEYGQEDRLSPGGGLAEEGEEITVIELPLDDLWERMGRGELPDLKTAFLLQALRLRRPDLFRSPVSSSLPVASLL